MNIHKKAISKAGPDKLAFTLVELIVVITILAILGTISFISLQGYSEQSRDSARISDVGNMKIALELFYLDAGKYPETTDGVNVTYSGTLNAWKQGIFGNNTFNSVESLDQIPTDPLTNKNYIYSVTNNKQEYQLGGILENGDFAFNNNLIDTSFAAGDRTAYAYISGKYNGKILKITDGDRIVILAVPTIISGDISLLSIEDLIAQSKLVYNGYQNLPSNYRGGNYNADGEGTLNLVNNGNIEVFSGTLDDLKIEANQISLISNLQDAYNGTDIINVGEIATILEVDTESNTEGTKFLSQNIINQNISSNVAITATNEPNPQYAVSDFVTVWDVGIDAGISGLNNLLLPLDSAGTFNFTVDWGDGTTDTITSWNQAEATHNYASSGTYTVVMNGQIDGFGFTVGGAWVDDADDGDKLLSVTQWGTTKIANGGNQFGNCENLTTFSNIDVPDLSLVTDMYGMFRSSPNFNSYLNDWDMSGVSIIRYMFAGASSFNQDLHLWNTDNMTLMEKVFDGATNFNGNISTWNTSQAQNLDNMFYQSSFNGDISNWDVGLVNSMRFIFSSTNFNGDISNWDTSSLSLASNMFHKNHSFNGDISSWNTSSLTESDSMFRETTGFNSLLTTSGSTWDMSGVIDMSYMFSKASGFNQDISSWDTSSLTNMEGMFQETTLFNQPLTTSGSIWDISNVNNMNYTFANSGNFNQDLSSWVTTLVSSCTSFDLNTPTWVSSKPIFSSCTP